MKTGSGSHGVPRTEDRSHHDERGSQLERQEDETDKEQDSGEFDTYDAQGETHEHTSRVIHIDEKA